MKHLNISIIIPTYNRPIYKVMNSINKQTYKPYEVIIISQENLHNSVSKIIKKKPGFDILLELIEKPSATKARNLGIEKARGDVILFLDDDISFGGNYLDNLADIFNRNKNVQGISGIVINRKVKFNSIKRFLKIYHEGEGNLLRSGQFSVKNSPKNLSKIQCCPITNFAILSKICKKFRFNEEIKGYYFCEDMLFTYEISRKYNLFVSPKLKIYHYIEEKGRETISEQVSKRLFIYFYHYKKLKKIYPKKMNFFSFLISFLTEITKENLFYLLKRNIIQSIKGSILGLSYIIMFSKGNKEKIPFFKEE